MLGEVIGRTLPAGHFHTAHAAGILRGSRARAERIRTLELEDLARFRLAAEVADAGVFWWTEQAAGSPVVLELGRVVFSFVPLVLVVELELRAWRLVDDGGHLVRLRREGGGVVFPVGMRMDAAYSLAFDGSDRKA